MSARAAVFRSVGQPFDLIEFPLPQPQGAEMLVEVIACTLCGSDLHSIHGRRAVPTPTILGHEILGRIQRFGPDALRVDAAGVPLAIGDRVTWTIVASCGTCIACERDLPQKCDHGFKYGHEPMDRGHALSGGLADHCLLVPGTAVFRIPESVSDATACPASCATATVAAALEASGRIEGRSVVILGAGMLGTTASAWCRSLGARDVIACDRDPARLSAMHAFGASATAAPEHLADVIATTTSGRGADVALELSGAPESIEAVVPQLAIGGVLVLIGTVAPTRSVPIDPERWVRGCLTLRGLHNYAPRHLRAALEFLTAHSEYPFDRLVAPWRPLADIDATVAAGTPVGTLRIGIRPFLQSNPKEPS